MTRDDIIRMARESNLMSVKFSTALEEMWVGQLERFANLVAAEEREACAKVCEVPIDLIQITDDCSEYVYKDHLDCAEAIRARGQHD